jgi:hypothetical protein
MKKFFVFLFFLLHTSFAMTQSLSDSSNKNSWNKYYLPFQKNTNSETKSVSRIAHYFYLGPGISKLKVDYYYAKDLDLRGTGFNLSYALAVKSHILTLSTTDIRVNYPAKLRYGYRIQTENTYLELMYGEAFRSKNLMISLSSGLSRMRMNWISGGPGSWYYINEWYTVFPFELKAFFHFRKIAGIGLVLKALTTPNIGVTNYYIAGNLVFGSWNQY